MEKTRKIAASIIVAALILISPGLAPYQALAHAASLRRAGKNSSGTSKSFSYSLHRRGTRPKGAIQTRFLNTALPATIAAGPGAYASVSQVAALGGGGAEKKRGPAALGRIFENLPAFYKKLKKAPKRALDEIYENGAALEADGATSAWGASPRHAQNKAAALTVAGGKPEADARRKPPNLSAALIDDLPTPGWAYRLKRAAASLILKRFPSAPLSIPRLSPSDYEAFIRYYERRTPDLIQFDFDKTVVDDVERSPRRLLAAVEALLAQNIPVAVITARPFDSERGMKRLFIDRLERKAGLILATRSGSRLDWFDSEEKIHTLESPLRSEAEQREIRRVLMRSARSLGLSQGVDFDVEVDNRADLLLRFKPGRNGIEALTGSVALALKSGRLPDIATFKDDELTISRYSKADSVRQVVAVLAQQGRTVHPQKILTFADAMGSFGADTYMARSFPGSIAFSAGEDLDAGLDNAFPFPEAKVAYTVNFLRRVASAARRPASMSAKANPAPAIKKFAWSGIMAGGLLLPTSLSGGLAPRALSGFDLSFLGSYAPWLLSVAATAWFVHGWIKAPNARTRPPLSHAERHLNLDPKFEKHVGRASQWIQGGLQRFEGVIRYFTRVIPERSRNIKWWVLQVGRMMMAAGLSVYLAGLPEYTGHLTAGFLSPLAAFGIYEMVFELSNGLGEFFAGPRSDKARAVQMMKGSLGKLAVVIALIPGMWLLGMPLNVTLLFVVAGLSGFFEGVYYSIEDLADKRVVGTTETVYNKTEGIDSVLTNTVGFVTGFYVADYFIGLMDAWRGAGAGWAFSPLPYVLALMLTMSLYSFAFSKRYRHAIGNPVAKAISWVQQLPAWTRRQYDQLRQTTPAILQGFKLIRNNPFLTLFNTLNFYLVLEPAVLLTLLQYATAYLPGQWPKIIATTFLGKVLAGAMMIVFNPSKNQNTHHWWKNVGTAAYVASGLGFLFFWGALPIYGGTPLGALNWALGSLMAFALLRGPLHFIGLSLKRKAMYEPDNNMKPHMASMEGVITLYEKILYAAGTALFFTFLAGREPLANMTLMAVVLTAFGGFQIFAAHRLVFSGKSNGWLKSWKLWKRN
ncbi:MAG: hypothetical protein HY611_09355 [Elusimicrobia bacterium]|nr:hypothetical protein [Elusimicrobiota bacterium]